MFLPNKRLAPKILALALPIIGGLSTQMILTLVDTAMVGRLENAEYALAAMGLGMLATWAIISVSASLSTGTHILVARRYGERQFERCRDVLINSIIIGVLFGALITALAMLFSHDIGHLFAHDLTVGELTGDYLFYRIMGLSAFMITVSFRGFFFGIGNVRVFIVSAILINLLNIFFNYIFIYGAFGLPRMGLAGAGFGSTLAILWDAAYHLIVAISFRAFRVRFRLLRHLKIVPKIMKTIFELSVPVSFQNVFTLLGFLIFIAITGIIGTTEQAATQTIVSTLFISFLPCNGFGIATHTLVGNNVGMGKKLLGKLYGFEAAKIATYYTIILGIIFIAFPDIILLITTDERHIIETAIPAMRIAGFAQIFYATGNVLANGLQAVGKTFFVMVVEGITMLLLFVPMCYLFGVELGWGLEGAWAAIHFYTIPYAIIMYSKFRYGQWRRLKAI